MRTIYALAGPPASGKTTTIHKIKHVLGIDDEFILDDVRGHRDWESLVLEKLGRSSVIIADIMFSASEHRAVVEAWGFPVKWFFMEKNPVQCIKNAIFRCVYMMPENYGPHGRNIDREINWIRSLSEQYSTDGQCVVEMPRCPDIGMLKQARLISGPAH